MSKFRIWHEPVASVSNMEVFRFVKEELDSFKKKDVSSDGSFTAFFEELVEYFKMTDVTKQTEEGLSKVIEESEKLGLSKNEAIQIINLKPKSHLDLQLIVEDCESRLTELQIENFLALCGTSL
ncbi:RNA pol Rpb4 domain containing protein [Trichuris trichiura]|uniref:DNA-directed RNA polymerase III subunit RPC9 n=1 Tax=Trichuris trichiura TaxID=36087 RepID=A0A077ZEF8_TRITR|nr:RNA pol Rpb4 domain containing protein [Trichuris trichiura]